MCSEGKRVLGIGGAAVGGHHFKLISIHPHNTLPDVLRGVSATVAPDETGCGRFGAWVYAICSNPIGQHVVSADSVESSINNGVSVACPAGTKVHRVGAFINLGFEPWRHLHLNRVGLFGPGALSGVDVAAHEDQTGYADDWHVHAYAICAP
ncbi:hypothetical protein CS0771_44600 [Catellatospora sp. IY07-71]|nr:hypothetical protein CS0771_44600 [Catellatospora sp. IY07-71]